MIVDEIMQLAQKYLVGYKKAGSNELKAVCPFHMKPDGSPERNPSFYMSLITGAWFCHACHERGSLRSFLRAVGMPRHVIELQYGMVLEQASKAIPKRLDPSKPGVVVDDPLPEALLGLFHYVPTDLLRDGFKEEVLSRFDVGFDKQHMRITFPMRDLEGKLFGISGRSVTGAEPRYKVYDKEYATFGLPARGDGEAKKRITIWNADQLYPLSLGTTQLDIILVEGFKACMWVYQAGFTHVAALLGSWLSEEQVWILEHFGARVFLMFDNDMAGYKARHYAGKILSRSLDVRVVEYGDEDQTQPDHLSEEEVHQAIEEAPDYFAWRYLQPESEEPISDEAQYLETEN